VTTNQSHFWHKKFSYNETKWLGRFACRCCCKLLGMGNAERCWGVVKQLKDGQRSHLSAAAASKQATIFGAACAERAAAKPPPAHTSKVTHWEEADMNSLGLTRFGVDADAIVAAGQPQRPFRCWSEDWEDTIVRNPDLEAQARFLHKYGGIVFRDGDDVFTVHPTKMYFCKRRGNSHWTLFCCKESYNPDQEFVDDYECFEMDQDFHGLVYEHYKSNPNPRIKVIVPPGALDQHGRWVSHADDGGVQPSRKKQRKS
jgi:hypothetical protein